MYVKINHTFFTLLNIYAPNAPNEDFFSSLLKLLLTKRVDNLILGGDFNTVLFPDLDRSTSAPQDMRASKVILHLMEQLSLCDPWRTQHTAVIIPSILRFIVQIRKLIFF